MSAANRWGSASNGASSAVARNGRKLRIAPTSTWIAFISPPSAALSGAGIEFDKAKSPPRAVVATSEHCLSMFAAPANCTNRWQRK